MADEMHDRRDLLNLTARDHEAIRDDLAPCALGTLDPTAAARVEAHLPTCPACASALRDYAEVLSLLPLALPLSQPPAGARSRLLDHARGAEAPTLERRPRRGAWLRSSSFRLALVVGLLLLATGAGVAVSGEFGQGKVPYRRTIMMSGSEHAPGALGMFVYGWRRGELIVSGLPALPPDRSYQLWWVAEDKTRVSGGVFGVDAHGNAAVPVELPENFRSFVRCDVTIEPAGGSPAPTGPNVLRGDLWA